VPSSKRGRTANGPSGGDGEGDGGGDGEDSDGGDGGDGLPKGPPKPKKAKAAKKAKSAPATRAGSNESSDLNVSFLSCLRSVVRKTFNERFRVTSFDGMTANPTG
jgi:hypothetical protein